MRKIAILSLLFLCLKISLAQYSKSPLYVGEKQIAWVDSVYQSMSMDQRLGQLFMVAAYSNKGLKHEQFIKNLIQKEHIGGLIFMQDNYNHQADLTNEYQALSRVPLLIGMDAEWDLSMRLKNTNKFPWAMTIGATNNREAVYEMGEKVAAHAHAMGVHFNFAPVVDVNVNPNNPIIGNRSFGSDPDNVADKAFYYMKGMQDRNVLASAKHFPGHGDTDKDSHKTLPTIPHSRERLEKVELKPFKRLVDDGVASIMVAHLNVPALEPNPNIPASLSKKIITDLLKNEWGFQGIIITDALNMKGVTSKYPNGLIDYMAFDAGNDILLFSQAVATGKAKIKKGLESGAIPPSRLEESVKKILMAKYFAGLSQPRKVVKTYLKDQLNDAESKALTHQLFEEAITLLKNENDILPIKNIANKRFGWIKLKEGNGDTFYTYLQKYVPIEKIDVSKGVISSQISKYDYIFISSHKSNASPYKSYKISTHSKGIISKVAALKPVIFTQFGSPYGLKNLNDNSIKALLVGYQNHKDAQMIVPQIIFGAVAAKGKLPVDVNSQYKAGASMSTTPLGRLGYDLPENVGMDSYALKGVDDIAEWAMQIKATPGMQVLAARKGKVFLDKTYGYKDYSKKEKIKWNDLYDVASITKIVSTLPLLMQKIEKKEISIYTRLESLIPQAALSNKSGITVKEILAHQAGLYPWIPFYKETLDATNLQPLAQYYSQRPSGSKSNQVAENMFIDKNWEQKIIDRIIEKENVSKRYKYSDLGYYLFKDYLEKSSEQTLDHQIENNFYRPLGMNYTTYLPLKKFPKSQIVPTENDLIFRHQLVRGYVHDQGAAMLGGIAGHAGIFSNSNDLAKIMQMYMNGGSYGGKKYLKPSTLNEFTSYQYPETNNRRGLGFDKQLDDKGPTCGCASGSGFGHTGFTGTMVWADPEQEIVYVFLSNRVHPNADNRKLIKHDIREKIQQRIYDAIQVLN